MPVNGRSQDAALQKGLDLSVKSEDFFVHPTGKGQAFGNGELRFVAQDHRGVGKAFDALLLKELHPRCAAGEYHQLRRTLPGLLHGMRQRAVQHLKKALAIERLEAKVNRAPDQLFVNPDGQLQRLIVEDVDRLAHLHIGLALRLPDEIVLLEPPCHQQGVALPLRCLHKGCLQLCPMWRGVDRRIEDGLVQRAAAQIDVAKGAHPALAPIAYIGKVQRGGSDVNHQRAALQQARIQPNGAGVLGVQKGCSRFRNQPGLREARFTNHGQIIFTRAGSPACRTAQHHLVVLHQQLLALEFSANAPQESTHVAQVALLSAQKAGLEPNGEVSGPAVAHRIHADERLAAPVHRHGG